MFKAQDFLFVLFILLLIGLTMGFVFGVLHGCEDEDECESLDVKCDGTLLLICNDDGEWEFVADCLDYIPDDWTCCEVNGEASCYHVEECQDAQ